MARTGHCNTCGKTIRPRAKDMSVGAASRLHYWKHHRDVMMAGIEKAKKPKQRTRARR